MIRLVVADDHKLLRDGIVRLIQDEEGFEVVGIADSGEEALRVVEQRRPEVVLLDVRMSGMGGIGAAREIRSRWPEVRIVLLTMHDDEETILEGLAAGASGYLLKDCSDEELFTTLRTAAAGYERLAGTPLQAVLAEFRRLRAAHTPASASVTESLLSPREREVLECVVAGQSNKQIARTLGIDETTVKTHLSKVFEKLDVRDRTQAAIHALQRGLVKPPET